MAAISQVVPNLLGGVSQQPDPLKLPGQVRQAENVLLDPTFGCRKRPPTQFIAKISDDVPTGAKWFDIFRDSNERYVVAIYRESDTTKIRVWEADTGVERTVNIEASAGAYLDVSNARNINPLTINDYTLLSNAEKIVTMSGSDVEETDAEALIVINQVAYNTTYAIDFLKDGEQLTQEKVYRATKVSISPGSFEEEEEGEGEGGSCVHAGTQSFNEDGSGDKRGLGFQVRVNCTPTLVTNEVKGDTYPTAVEGSIPSQVQIFFTAIHGSVTNYAIGSYLYHTTTTTNGNLTLRVECRVNARPASDGNYDDGKRYDLSSVSIVSYVAYDPEGNKKQPWAVGNGGYEVQGGVQATYTVTSVGQGQASNEYEYKSVYQASVTLNNGGVNWRVGDTVSVNMNGKDYTITVQQEAFGYGYVSEASVSHTTALNTDSGTLDVGGIVGSLVSEITALENYQATPIGNVIHVKRTDGRDFNIQTKGGTVNSALYGIKSSVNDITLLPNQCVPGVVLLVRNSADSDADDYYVKFKPASGDIPGQGAWEETVKPGIDTQLNNSTMPHAMIREADGTFTVRPLSAEFDEALFWAGREVGDENSNPEPSFVGQTIKDMFFYMNRLGFLSSDSVILSQPGDYFNFFVGSAIAVSDADPIDMTASSTKPATLKAALGTPKGLLLFAENSQFLLSTSEAAFGPSTVKMSELSNYSYSSNVHPLETGVSVMFATEADTFSKVYEMAVDSIDNRPLVSENTRIVPEYIPPGLTLSASSPNNSLVMFGDGTETLYTFKFFNTGNERSLAGWSKWILPRPVELIAFDHDTGYIVLNNDGSHILLKLEMLDDPRTSPIQAFGSKFAPRLDNSLFKSQTTIEEVDAFTQRVRFPEGAYVLEKQPNIILTIDGTSTLYRSPEIQEDETGFYIEVGTDIAESDFIVGLEYDMIVELPSFFVSQEKKADRRNIPMVENVYLDLYYSGRYSVAVERKGYITRNVDLDVTDADIYLANDAAIDETTSRQVPVYCRGDFVKLKITAADPLPASITSYRWEGHYNNRGIATI